MTLPTIFRLTDQTGEEHHPSAVEYLASLPDAAIWIVTAAINFWIFALISTVAAIYLRRRQIRRLAAE